jgi:hypothetical protein
MSRLASLRRLWQAMYACGHVFVVNENCYRWTTWPAVRRSSQDVGLGELIVAQPRSAKHTLFLLACRGQYRDPDLFRSAP